MFEHVGLNHYAAFFRAIRAALRSDGVALVHAIGRASGPGTTNPWLTKYVFPGGYSPALSEVLPAVERSGLWLTDLEILRLHYAETLRHWRRRFEANRGDDRQTSTTNGSAACSSSTWPVARSRSGARTRWCGKRNSRRRQDTLPLTRDYMHEAEQGLAEDPGALADRLMTKKAGSPSRSCRPCYRLRVRAIGTPYASRGAEKLVKAPVVEALRRRVKASSRRGRR